ncbi:MAG: hypothetical protein HKO71_05330 [Pseudomonadales bacterium]|nr:hypothetical protein [Pseudomonadales bacterium]
MAAATIGTVAVAVTVASLEVDDYCDAQRSLQEDANVLYGSSIEFDLQRCVAQGLKNSEAVLREVKNSAGKLVFDALESGTTYSVEKWQAVKQQALEALQLAGDAAYRLWDAMQAQLVNSDTG